MYSFVSISKSIDCGNDVSCLVPWALIFDCEIDVLLFGFFSCSCVDALKCVIVSLIIVMLLWLHFTWETFQIGSDFPFLLGNNMSNIFKNENNFLSNNNQQNNQINLNSNPNINQAALKGLLSNKESDGEEWKITLF